MSHYLIFLAIIPMSCFHLAKMFGPGRLWLWTGLSAGLVIAPVSQGLVEYTLIPVIGGMLGLVGAVFDIVHASVGYFLLAAMGVFEPGQVLTAPQFTLMHLVNGLIWTTYYGIVGFRMDLKFSRKPVRKYAAVPVAARVSHSQKYL